MFDLIYEESSKRAKHKIWLISDLQQEKIECTKECLDISIEDFKQLNEKYDMLWYLGDAVEGIDKDVLVKNCAMQEKKFEELGVPICYCLGNHDLQYATSNCVNDDSVFLPFYDIVKRHKNWHTIENFSQPYFKVPLGRYMVYFLSDHIAEDKSWYSIHGRIFDENNKYPHIETYKKIKSEISREQGPVILAAHYSFLGGNRPSKLFDNLLPLPQNVKIHFYGHAHIGDYDWAKENAYRRISWVDWHDIPQINVSSFEHIRGDKCRSIFLHIYEDDSFGIFFRNHDDGIFTECYFPSKNNYQNGYNLRKEI